MSVTDALHACSTRSEREALHPLRRDTPVTSRCTRSEGVQCLQIGCTASHNKHNRGQFAPTDPNRPPQTLRHSFDMLARLRTRGAAPVTSRYTRYVAMHPIRRGAMPTDRVHRLPQQAKPRAFPPDTPKRLHQTQPHTLEIPARLRTRGTTPVTSRYTRHVAKHPLRRDTPVTSRYTRSEGVQCLRIGCTASHNKPNRGHFLPTHPSGCIRRSHTTSKYPPGSEREALHPLRRGAPVTSRNTRYVAIHPLRRNAPVTSQCTRSEGVQCLRIGCTAT